MNPQLGLKHVATEPLQLGNKRERRRGPSGRAAALRRAPSDSDCSAETGSLSADSAERAPRPLPTLERSGKTRSRRRGSEWEVLEGLKDGQRFEKRPEVFNGYLHKKRKWPLKGWHKRFFVIDGGILVYARSPTDVARGRLHGSVDVGLSVISAKQRRRRIDIDADEFIYHLRAKTQDVFRTWLLVLKAHRLYRQHLLTFGTREAPKIHAPDELPPTEGSSNSLKEKLEIQCSNYRYQRRVSLCYCKVDSLKCMTCKNRKIPNDNRLDHKTKVDELNRYYETGNVRENQSMFMQCSSSVKYSSAVRTYDERNLPSERPKIKENGTKSLKVKRVALKHKSQLKTPKRGKEEQYNSQRKYVTCVYQNKEFLSLTRLLQNHIDHKHLKLELKQDFTHLRHRIEHKHPIYRSKFTERNIARAPLQRVVFKEIPENQRKYLKDKAPTKIKRNMLTYVMMFTNKKKNACPDTSLKSMKKSKKSTNVVKYKNVRFEPPLKNMTSKFVLLNNYHIAPVTSYHFRTDELNGNNAKPEYDRITDKLVTTIFDVNKPKKTQDIAIIKAYVERAVKDLCEVRVNASQQVQQLFRNLLEFYLTSSAAATGKSVGSQIEIPTKDAYLQMSLKTKVKGTQTKTFNPSLASLENDELIQQLENTLRNTIYCCKISNTIKNLMQMNNAIKSSFNCKPSKMLDNKTNFSSEVQSICYDSSRHSIENLIDDDDFAMPKTTSHVSLGSQNTERDSGKFQKFDKQTPKSYYSSELAVSAVHVVQAPQTQSCDLTGVALAKESGNSAKCLRCSGKLDPRNDNLSKESDKKFASLSTRNSSKRLVLLNSMDLIQRSKELLKSSMGINRHSVPVFNGLVSPTAAAIRGPQAGFVCGTPGGRLASWIIESGGPLENASKELGQAQLSVQQLQRLLDSLELQQQAHHDTDVLISVTHTKHGSTGQVSLEGASPNVKKDRRKFGLRKKKSATKCASIELAPPQHMDPSNSHMALSALTAPPSPGGGASSVPNSAASLPIACAAARPQSLPGAEALGGGGGPASLSSLTPDHQLREDFTILAKDLVQNLKSIVGTLICERGRLRSAMDAADTTSSPNGAMVSALRTNLTSALQQNSELRSRLSRIHDASDLAELSTMGHNSDPVGRFHHSLSYSSSCVSASEFFDAEEHDDEKQPEIIEPDETGVIELDGDSSSEAGSLSSEEGSASSDNSEGAMLRGESAGAVPPAGGGGEGGSTSAWSRRTRLPSPRPTPGGPSLWNLLYKNIGKDLSQVSMPVTINEPLNMLQRLCEELEYSELLEAASECRSPVERVALVAAFAVSAYASAAHRAASKPFNPLLGETYECVRDDKGFRFIAEQVSHHPPISACHAESPRWCLWQEARIKTKFWGKSMEFQPTGRVHLRFHTNGDHYSWNKVTTCVHNLFGGQRWVDQYGDMQIICHGADISCKLQFIKASSWSTSRHEVRGAVHVGNSPRLRIQGRWSESLHAGDPPAARCLWRPGAMPPEHEVYYGFTRFAMELNELEPGMRQMLPHTDTRLRPDQRALEEGDVESAEQYKHQLEQAQRDRRRDSPEHTPMWFRKSHDAGEEMWVFNGEYWKAREAGFSEDTPKIW